MAKYKIVTPMGASFSVAGTGYEYEMEALEGMDAEFVEVPATEDGFIAGAQDADAIYVKGMSFNKKMIDALPAKCRALVLGSVGVDSVDVAAATARGIPVTNCPDTFIEEVADHAMALLLSCQRRLIEQDRMVREGRWREGRPQLLQMPRLMGPDARLRRVRPRGARGRDAREAVRPAADGLRPVHRGTGDAAVRRACRPRSRRC